MIVRVAVHLPRGMARMEQGLALEELESVARIAQACSDRVARIAEAISALRQQRLGIAHDPAQFSHHAIGVRFHGTSAELE
jgi:hypothetical protein